MNKDAPAPSFGSPLDRFNAFLTHDKEIHSLKQRVRTLEEKIADALQRLTQTLEEKDDPMMGFIADRDPGDENDTPRPTPYHQFDGNLNGY